MPSYSSGPSGGGGLVAGGPTPWWQQEGYRGSLNNYTKAAPPGYEYDPVKQEYVRTPTSAGTRVNDFTNAAYPGLNQAMTGLYSAAGMPSAGGATGTGASVSGTVSAGGGGAVTGGGYAAPIAAPDTTGATNAAYASAKDKVGNTARGALTSLNDELGGAGMLGSGAQVKGTEDVINQGQEQLGETARGQAGKQADLSADFAKTGYQGAITQRGQDINAQEANARLALESRQQYMQMIQAAMSGLGRANGSGGATALY